MKKRNIFLIIFFIVNVLLFSHFEKNCEKRRIPWKSKNIKYFPLANIHLKRPQISRRPDDVFFRIKAL